MDEWIPILTGPTAVGKTDLSLELAESLKAEIVSADSRQIYRNLDIGTAKPRPTIRERVPHHFIDELDVGESYSAGRYQEDAYRRITEIKNRGKSVLIVGGSTLYIYALKHGLANIPHVPNVIRQSLQDRLATEGADSLYEELRQVDPEVARSMDPTKTQRLVRALEVYEHTGRPLSSYYAEQPAPPFDIRTFVLHRERKELYDRINTRVDQMLAEGLLEEVRSILSRGFDLSFNPLRTIGYREVIHHLDDEITHDEMVRLIKRNSRRYAKRQLTWFRRDPGNTWLEADRPPAEILSRIVP